MSINYDAYLAANPDVAAAVARGDMTAEQHYTNYGQYEGRDLGGSTSGAQSHFWDSDTWQGLPGNGGGNNTTGARSSSAVPTPNLSNIRNDASFYRAGAEFEGNKFNVGLGPGQLDNLKSMLDGGMSFNEAVIRLSGDGIGTEVFMPKESGYLPHGIDLSTGKAITSHAGGSGGGGGGTAPVTPPGTTIPNPTTPPPPTTPPGTTPPDTTAPPTPTTPTNPTTPSSQPPMGMMAFWQQLQKDNPQEAATISGLPSSQQTRALVQAYRKYLQQRGTGLLDIAKRDPFTQGFEQAQAR